VCLSTYGPVDEAHAVLRRRGMLRAVAEDLEVVQVIYRLGGVASRARLVGLTSRAAVDRALAHGSIRRDGHGRYSVPVADVAIRVANALSGTVSHRSAATWWGWEQKCPDHEPEVTVPRKRHVGHDRRRGVSVHWADLAADDVEGGVTSMRRTLVDCLRALPFDEALAIADSALRNGSVSHQDLGLMAAELSGPGAARCRRVAAAADGRAANPFESVLRAMAVGVRGLDLVPQVAVSIGHDIVRPDLVDEARRVVAEADSFTWHGSRGALRRDCRRYTALTVRGWTVLRFAWEDVMHDPAHVRRELAARQARARSTARLTA
jgi:very-short-patch-repair endonuclease